MLASESIKPPPVILILGTFAGLEAALHDVQGGAVNGLCRDARGSGENSHSMGESQEERERESEESESVR